MCPLSGRESGGARPRDATISRQPYRHRITTASSRIRPELTSPAGLTATCAGLHAVGGRCAGSDCIGDQATWPAHLYIATTRGNARSCRDAVRPGARALICRLPAGAPALVSEHCGRLWLQPRAEVLAEVGLEVPVLCEPQGGAMPKQAGSLRRHRGSRYRVNPGPKAPAGAFGLCEPAEAGPIVVL
jgi:hypothetical protein